MIPNNYSVDKKNQEFKYISTEAWWYGFEHVIQGHRIHQKGHYWLYNYCTMIIAASSSKLWWLFNSYNNSHKLTLILLTLIMSNHALVICFSAIRSLLMSWNTVLYKGLELSLISLYQIGGHTKKMTFKCKCKLFLLSLCMFAHISTSHCTCFSLS